MVLQLFVLLPTGSAALPPHAANAVALSPTSVAYISSFCSLIDVAKLVLYRNRPVSSHFNIVHGGMRSTSRRLLMKLWRGLPVAD